MTTFLFLIAVSLDAKEMCQTPVVGNLFIGEVDGFRRFAESRGEHSMIAMSAEVVAIVDCDRKRFDLLVRDYAREFGVDFSKVTNGKVPVNFPYLELHPSMPLAPRTFWKRYGKGTAAFGAYNRLVKRRVVRSTDAIVSLRYRIRPFLTENLRRFDWVEGAFEVIRRGRHVTVPTLF